MTSDHLKAVPSHTLHRTLSDNQRNFASPLHHHLYESGFLQGGLSDLRIEAFGRIYSLHRLVLAQSDFFRSLLSGGFSEQEKTSTGDLAVIPLRFDANCSRSAFEYCLARIYGGGPELLLPPTSKPDQPRGYPLTETFTRKANGENYAPTLDYGDRAPSELQVATPAFLLSLLATATYLELSAVASAAISLIQETVTPYTVTVYLRFALGDGVPGPLGEEACAGLEGVSTAAVETTAPPPQQATGYFYGEAADRVGEACACWVARWATDIIAVEEQQSDHASPSFRIFSWTNLGGLSSEWIRILLSSDSLFLDRDTELEQVDSSEKVRYELAKRIVELRRRQMTAWLSSEMAPSFLDLQQDAMEEWTDEEAEASVAEEESKRTTKYSRKHRRGRSMASSVQGLVLEDDEAEYERLFAEGIYFSHLPFDHLQALVNDISPSTGQPYVPQEVLFRAHWDTSRLTALLRATPPPLSATLSPEDTDKARAFLGLMSSFDAPTPWTADRQPSSARRWVVPVDETIRYNDPIAAISPIIEPIELTSPSLYETLSTSPPGAASQVGASTGPPKAKLTNWMPMEKFFGLANGMVTGDATEEMAPGLEGRSFVPFEPFRFSLEFWGIDQLKEKQRLYSRTVSYAGSSWNIYLQVLRKAKSRPQLGIYLHRQAPNNAIQPPSHPPHDTSSITSPSSLVDPTRPSERDTRSSVQVYFALSCPSLPGTSLTRFASGPDGFTLNQSWGWKSSSLKGDDYIAIGTTSEEATTPMYRADLRRAARLTSLRASVCMGVV